MPSGSVISLGSCRRPARSRTAYSTACCATSPSSPAIACRWISVLVRPSLMATVRRTTEDTAGSCVTISTVTPSSEFARCRAPNTSAAVAVSSSPVGSSARSTFGSLTSATAMAARCCSPPDSWSGRRCRQSPRPSRSSSSAARFRRRPALGLARAGQAAVGEPHRQFHVLLRGQVGQQVARGLLPDEAHRPAPVGQPLPLAQRGQVLARHPDRARGGRVQPGQDVHQGGLAAARRAHQRDDLALVHQQVEPLQGLDLDPGRDVDPDQPVAHDQRPRAEVPLPRGTRSSMLVAIEPPASSLTAACRRCRGGVPPWPPRPARSARVPRWRRRAGRARGRPARTGSGCWCR